MKIRPIFKTIDIFSFIQFLSRQTNYIIKFFLLKVLYLVREKGYTDTLFFVDDGITGTTMKRPGFQKMLTAIEPGISLPCLLKTSPGWVATT